MSFWAGVASGFKDAKAAKAEKEELEARRAERQATFEYNKGRDKILDERAEAKRIEDLRQWNITNDRAAKIYKEGREDRLAKEAQAQENFELTFSTSQEWKGKEWALGLDKWDFTKDQAKEATAHSNKLFNLALDKFEYKQDRDVVQDALNFRAEARTIAEALRVKEAQTFNQELANKNFELREQQFEEQMRAAGVSEDLAQRGFDLKERAAGLAYTKAIVDLVPASLASALGGGDGKVVPIGSNAAAMGSTTFIKKYNTELSKQEQESPFFKAALSSASAQTTLEAFIGAQGEKGNEIKLSELPQYFNYLGAVQGKNQKEAKEVIKDMMKGDGLKDPEAMAKGLLVLKGYRPTEQLFQQKALPADAGKDKEGFGIWKTAIANEARIAFADLPDGEKKDKLETAIAGIKFDDSPVHYQVLAELGYGKKIQSEYNLDKNTLVQSFYGEPVEDAVTEGGAEGGAEGGSTPTLKNSIDNPTLFNSPEDIQEARLKGFSGFVKMGEKVFEVDPYSEEENYPNAEPAGMGTTPVVTDEDRERLNIEEMEAELLAMKEFEEEDNLKESGGIVKVIDKQAEALSTMGKGVSEEQAEGNRPGEKEIDTDTFVDRSFKGEGTVEEPMDLAEANATVVSDKVVDVVDSIPPRTPKKNRVKWAMEEFKKRYKNATVHMSEDEIEIRIKSLVNSNQ